MPVFSTLAAAAGTIGTTALIGGGTAAALALNKKKKPESGIPSPQPLPQSPNPMAAEESAQRQVEAKRRIRARTGGQTILTQTGMPTGSSPKTLLGA